MPYVKSVKKTGPGTILISNRKQDSLALISMGGKEVSFQSDSLEKLYVEFCGSEITLKIDGNCRIGHLEIQLTGGGQIDVADGSVQKITGAIKGSFENIGMELANVEVVGECTRLDFPYRSSPDTWAVFYTDSLLVPVFIDSEYCGRSFNQITVTPGKHRVKFITDRVLLDAVMTFDKGDNGPYKIALR
jgi:hypothetical protein